MLSVHKQSPRMSKSMSWDARHRIKFDPQRIVGFILGGCGGAEREATFGARRLAVAHLQCVTAESAGAGGDCERWVADGAEAVRDGSGGWTLCSQQHALVRGRRRGHAAVPADAARHYTSHAQDNAAHAGWWRHTHLSIIIYLLFLTMINPTNLIVNVFGVPSNIQIRTSLYSEVNVSNMM